MGRPVKISTTLQVLGIALLACGTLLAFLRHPGGTIALFLAAGTSLLIAGAVLARAYGNFKWGGNKSATVLPEGVTVRQTEVPAERLLDLRDSPEPAGAPESGEVAGRWPTLREALGDFSTPWTHDSETGVVRVVAPDGVEIAAREELLDSPAPKWLMETIRAIAE